MSRKRKGPKRKSGDPARSTRWERTAGAPVDDQPAASRAELEAQVDHAHPPQAGASFLRPVSETTGRYETDTPTFTQAGTPWPQPRDGARSEAGRTPLGRENEERLIARGHGSADASGINVAGDRVSWDTVAEVMKTAPPPKTKANTMVSRDRGLASLGVPSVPCVLCGGPIVGMGHNAQPLAEGRCCDACNTSAVIPARIGSLGLPSPHTPTAAVAAASAGERIAETVPDVPEVEVSAADVIRWTPALGPGRITHASAVPEFRAWLIRQWQPGGGFHQAAKAMANTPRGRLLGKTNLEALATDADVERRTLQRAALYYVEPPMVALLASCAPSCPPDVRPVDLVSAADEGLVVLAEPVIGTAADTGSPVETWAFTWSRTMLRTTTLPGDRDLIARYGERIPCLSVGTYRLVDFDRGLHGSELHAAALVAAGVAPQDMPPAGTPVSISGHLWTPMGRSDWPIGDTLAGDVPWALDEPMAASIREDRALIAAMFTLLAEDHVAAQIATSAPRAAVRRLTRAGITTPDPGRVVVVNLRRPKTAPPDEPAEDGPTGPRTYTHSWLVREHLRWQPVGPGRKERRLTVVRAHTKGTGPLVLKQKVQRWVR